MNDTDRISSVGPSWCRLHPDIERWATEVATLARGDLQGKIMASVWPYRGNGTHGAEMLTVDLTGAKGGDFNLTFRTGRVARTDYAFSDLRTTCFEVPDLTEAFSMAALLLEKLSASVKLPSRC